jgi:ferredoxin
MSELKNKYPRNVAGKFYVDNQCIDCDCCRELASKNFSRVDDEAYDEAYYFVCKQPENEQEERDCRMALDACPVEAIGIDTSFVNTPTETTWPDETTGSKAARENREAMQKQRLATETIPTQELEIEAKKWAECWFNPDNKQIRSVENLTGYFLQALSQTGQDGVDDTKMLDWCEKNLLHLFDGGGTYGIEFGSLSKPQKLDMFNTIRDAIRAAIASEVKLEE